MPVQRRNSELVHFLKGEFMARIMPFGFYTGFSGWMIWEFDGLDATTEVIIANGPSEPLYGLSFQSLVRSSGGVLVRTDGLIAVNASEDIFNDGTASVSLRVLASGQVDVRRTGGVLTFKIQLLLNWL